MYNFIGSLKQVEDEKEKRADDLYEMSKPLARYADDEDLDTHLKQKEIESLDPMLEYIQAKKRKKETKEGKGNERKLSIYLLHNSNEIVE